MKNDFDTQVNPNPNPNFLSYKIDWFSLKYLVMSSNNETPFIAPKKDTSKFVCPFDSDDDEDLPLQPWQIAILTDRVETRRNYSPPPAFPPPLPSHYRYSGGPCYCLSQAPR